MSQTVAVHCPAKVNLALSIGSPGPDGMHPLASWMVALNFGDHLALTVADAPSSHFDIAFADDAPRPGEVDWPLEKDLAYRAHRAMEPFVNRPLPMQATIRKRIPAGAGLGGGSANAAGMLVALCRLYDLSIDEPALTRLAATLGSDVAFAAGALLGRPSALVTGLGETLEDAPLREPLHLVLILPPFGCPTGPVYRAFDDRTTVPVCADADRVRALTRMSPLPQDAPFNDLAAPACDIRPELGDLLTTLHEKLALPVHVIAPSALTAKVLARKVAAETGLTAVATRTMG